jgi:hypothetical protein
VAKRGREGAIKRAREKARQDKQEAKRENKLGRSLDETTSPPVDEEALMEEFARLSASYQANRVSEQHYNTERQRIFAELGIEAED